MKKLLLVLLFLFTMQVSRPAQAQLVVACGLMDFIVLPMGILCHAMDPTTYMVLGAIKGSIDDKVRSMSSVPQQNVRPQAQYPRSASVQKYKEPTVAEDKQAYEDQQKMNKQLDEIAVKAFGTLNKQTQDTTKRIAVVLWPKKTNITKADLQKAAIKANIYGLDAKSTLFAANRVGFVVKAYFEAK